MACTATLTGHAFTVLTLALGRDAGGTLYSGSWDHTVRVWRTADGECLHSLGSAGLSSDAIWALALNKDCSVLYSASSDCTVREWALPSDVWRGCGARCQLLAPDWRMILQAMLPGSVLESVLKPRIALS